MAKTHINPDAIHRPANDALHARRLCRSEAARLRVGPGCPRIKLTTYVVDYQPSHRPALVAARSEVLGDIEPPASVLLGVQALVAEDLLVEVDAVAALD